MIIQSLELRNGPFVIPIEITPTEATERSDGKNWTTAMIGENGSRKSLLLRLLTEFGLGHGRYTARGYPHIQIDIPGRDERLPIRKVIAISGTPLDRFPRGGAPGPRRVTKQALNVYDRLPYIYLGQRANNGMAGALQSERNLAQLLLAHSNRLSDSLPKLTAIFKRVGISDKISIRLKCTKNLLSQKNGSVQLSDALFDKHTSLLHKTLEQELSRSTTTQERIRELKSFVSFMRNNGDYVAAIKNNLRNMIAPITLPLFIQEIKRRELQLSEWRTLVTFGYVEIVGLSLSPYPDPDDKQPDSDLEKKNLTGTDLSSGQWSWLSTLAGLTLELEDDALILIDEPENSLHPSWQRDYVQAVQDVLSGFIGCQVVIATHSPLIASGVSPSFGNVQPLERGTKLEGEVTFSRQLNHTYGWSASDVYQSVFNMDSTRAPHFLDRISHALALVQKGVKKNYSDLATLVPALEDDLENLPAVDPMRSVINSIIREVSQNSSRG